MITLVTEYVPATPDPVSIAGIMLGFYLVLRLYLLVREMIMIR